MGAAVLVAGVVGAAVTVGTDVGEACVAAPGASTVTVTVRRGVGRSVMPQAVRASAAADPTHTARRAPRAVRLGRGRDSSRGDGRAPKGLAEVTSGMALKSGTDRAAGRMPRRVTYSGRVLRGLLSPKWLGLLALVLVIVAACTLLGLWQLGVARDEGHKQAVAAASQLQRAPLQQVTQAHSAFEPEFSNRPVTVTGTYDDTRTILVVDRRLGDRAGSWVVTPLVTEGGTVAVLRGFVDGVPATAPAAPAGVVTVEGSLGPTESPRPGAPLPAPQRRSVDLASLVNEWPGDLYNVVLLASDESDAASRPSAAPLPTPGLTRVPPPDVDTPLNLRNA